MRNPVPRSIGPKCNGTPASLAMLFVVALSGCTTFKPPQISYDDDVPPSPDLTTPLDEHVLATTPGSPALAFVRLRPGTWVFQTRL